MYPWQSFRTRHHLQKLGTPKVTQKESLNRSIPSTTRQMWDPVFLGLAFGIKPLSTLPSGLLAAPNQARRTHG